MNVTKSEITLGASAVAVFALALIFLYVSDRGPDVTDTNSAPVSEVPAITPLMQQVLEKSSGFQLLVSYTNEGFQPALASIQAGDTVRFTNNSNKELWVSAARVLNGDVYPGGAESCGPDDFDSCVRMQPKEFWEFTFEKKGVWGYINIALPGHEATLEVY